MAKHAETVRKELDRAQQECDALRRDNQRLTIENARRETLPAPVSAAAKKPKDTLTTATIWLAVGTFLSIAVIAGGTFYTIHEEEENKFLPLLVLGTRDEYANKDSPAHTIFIRNIGFGPALNAVTQTFKVGGRWLRLKHRTAIATTNDDQDIAAEDSDDGKTFKAITTPLREAGHPLSITPTTRGRGDRAGISIQEDAPVLKRVTLVSTINTLFDGAAAYVCTSYENARRERYETWHEVQGTPMPENLQINFLCQKKTSNYWESLIARTPKPCTEACLAK